jgi:2-polyprenyl-3-methyl-5-hydroxy-6-metoxy-1,4-benzoquinol methylase
MLATRTIADELMDADDLDPVTFAAVLADLAQVNTITMARRPTLDFLQRVLIAAWREQAIAFEASHAPGHIINHASVPLKILDVGFGDGDMLRRIARWGAGRKVSLNLVGIDLNPNSVTAAKARTPADMAIEYRTGDYQDLAGQQFDVILSSLVAHHMTHDQLVAFLRFMDAEAQRGWFINDLHRHGFAYLGYPLLSTLMRWHPIVRHDGRLSIARSYRPAEWPPILAEADVTSARIVRAFPFRLCVERVR